MTQNENLIKKKKKDTRKSLDFYKNLVQESLLNSKDLVEKATDVREKLNCGQKVNKNIPQEIPDLSKQIKKEISNQKTVQTIEKTSFRKEAKFSPKIQIFNQRALNKSETNSKRPPKNQGILSLYDHENLTFYPIPNSLSTESTNNNEESDAKKNEQRAKIIRNNIDYDNKIKPLFFTNRYVEYSYQDKGDNLYEDGDLLRYLFEKKIKKEKNPGLYIVKQDSIYLDNFKKLLKKLKDEKEEDMVKPSTDSTVREDNTLASDEIKRINRYKNYKSDTKSKSSSSGGGGAGESKEEKVEKVKNKTTDFKSYFLSKISLCENNAIAGALNETNLDKSGEKENPSLGKSTADVSFNIDIEAQISKKLKNKKEVKRKMKIIGPIVTLFKVPSGTGEIHSVKEKGKFDIRNIRFEDNENLEINNGNNDNNNNDLNLNGDFGITKRKVKENKLNINFNLINSNDNLYKEQFTVKKVIENGKDFTKQLIFFSQKIKEFQNKTYKYFFSQLQKYYKDFISNIENASYNVLKFLSNPNCTSLEIGPTESQKLLDNLYWHPKLQILSIPTSYVASLKEVMDSKNWECILTTLSINQDAGVSSPPFEESIYKLFSGINSIPIQNIHFIDVPYNRKVADSLFNHIELFYSINNTILNSFFGVEKPSINSKNNNNINNRIFNINSSEKDITTSEEVDEPKTSLFLNIQKTKLPIVNLSWKKNPNQKMNSSRSEDAIDLRAIYYILMEMLIRAYKFNNHRIPEVFNKLDLSETIVTDDVGFLVKIITQFKIIKELDISNTKLLSYGRVINSDHFLKKIKLTNKFTSIMDIDEENLIMDKVQKDIDFFRNCTEQQKSQLSDFLEDEEMSYNYFMGIFPILEKMYVYNTDIKENVARDIYMLFKKLKFFNGFYCSSSGNENNNYILLNTINKITDVIQNDSSNYCENIFLISNKSY